MIRITQHKLYSTSTKTNELEEFHVEYNVAVNKFIDLFWDLDTCPKYTSKEHYNVVKEETWLSARVLQNAGSQAISTIQSLWKKNNSKIFKTYKRVFAKAKDKNKEFPFMTVKFSELDKSKFRKRMNKPKFDGNIELTANCCEIQEGKNSFDLWIKISSIGDKKKFLLPTKHHKHSLKYTDWDLKKSIRLSKVKNDYYVGLYHEKKDLAPKPEGKSEKTTLGIDLGINKLLSLSSDKQYGVKFKELVIKLQGKKQYSKKYNKLIKQIHNYIGEEVNKMDLTKINSVVLEDLTNIQKNTKKKLNKTTRYYLSRWNKTLVQARIKNLCEVNRINYHEVKPEYTSQTCNSCGVSHKSSRNKESYDCKCGYSANADINASKNIRDKFLGCGAYSPAQQENNQLNDLPFNS